MSKSASRVFLGIDVGEKRIGLALSQGGVRIAWPLSTIDNDDDVDRTLQSIVNEYGITDIIVGRPRNQSGEPTEQTRLVEAFATKHLKSLGGLKWQDESATSVLAEQRLRQRQKIYSKSEIDAEAAAIILQDYLEANL